MPTGAGASIDLGADVVTWRIQHLGSYRFDRAEYEVAIAGLPDQDEVPFPPPSTDTDA